jgi:predicted acylesterase/phospholipase RssA
MPDSKGRRHAVILSGGGANGAYEVGVLKGLFAGNSPATDFQPLLPEVLAGTSIGAYNAALLVGELASRGSAAIDHLEHIWLDVMPQDDDTGHNFVARYRGDLFEYLDPNFVFRRPIEDSRQVVSDLAFLAGDFFRRGLVFFESSDDIENRILKLFDLSIIVSNEPESRLIRETINFNNIQQSKTALRVAVTNWRTGELRVFANNQLDERMGAQAILASTAIPGIFPQVQIDDDYYADGGLVMNTPLNVGIDAGADVLHIVYLDPDVKAIPLLPVRNTIDTFSRIFAIQFAATVNRDITVATQINEGLDVIDKVAKGEQLSTEDVRAFVVAAARLSRLDDYSKYRKITIHRYQPPDTLTGILGLLNFARDKSIALIAEGLTDAINHDCKTNKCILAGD